MSTVEEIRTAIPKLSVEEKLQTMEALWQSLSSKPDAVESPAWHEKELRDRERDIESGKSKFIDWEKTKRTSVVKLREDRNPAGGAGRLNRRISLLREPSTRIGFGN